MSSKLNKTKSKTKIKSKTRTKTRSKTRSKTKSKTKKSVKSPSFLEKWKMRQMLNEEIRVARVDAPDLPRLRTITNFKKIIHHLRTTDSKVDASNPSYSAVFIIGANEGKYDANITRAIQEDQILKVRLKVMKNGKPITLPSFWERWFENPALRKRIKNSSDPYEEIWRCMIPFNYKLATTFMPSYAKAIYKYFGGGVVLDPCSGWGDRMLGAETSGCVSKYVAFDPNRDLRAGYAETMNKCGVNVINLTSDKIQFSNSFEMYCQPFETGILAFADNSFDFVFTSPPFFDYEDYNPQNPNYKDWIKDFYVPLFMHCCRCVKPRKHVAIYIGDTSAGKINQFILEVVEMICPLKMIKGVGFMGLESKKVRGIWVFEKLDLSVNVLNSSFTNYAKLLQSNK
jgi:hypothetical protein